MKRWEYHVIMSMLGTIILAILAVTIMAVWPYDVLEIPQTADLVNKDVKKGEDLQYIGYMQKKMSLPSRQECYFQDGIRYMLPSRWTNREPGFYKEIVHIAIPATLPTGTTYTYCCDITYEPNPFQSVEYHWCSVPFNYSE